MQVIQEQNKNCPGIIYDPASEILQIVGRSIPENPEVVFKPLREWVLKYFSSNDKLKINILLEYINSGSKKYLTNFLAKLNEFYLEGKEVIIYWNFDYDDESMQELGNDLKSMIQIPFHIVEVD